MNTIGFVGSSQFISRQDGAVVAVPPDVVVDTAVVPYAEERKKELLTIRMS
jgi:hypothetical protein